MTGMEDRTDPGDVKVPLGFLKWSDLYTVEKPFQIYIDIPPESPDQRFNNLEFEKEETTVRNVRTQNRVFSLDGNGFVYVSHRTTVPLDRFKDKDFLQKVYLPECEKVIYDHVDSADQVFIFDWRVRYTDTTEFAGKLIDYNDPVQPLGPATDVHIDQSDEAALRRVQLHLPDQADRLLRGRLRIINVWRPLKGPVKQWPLAVCDGTTIKPQNLIETDHVRRQYAGCTLYALKDASMKWYYMKDQQDDEVLLFKNFDSKEGVARYAPHAALELPDPPGEILPPRWSIEVRCLVFTYEENI